MKMTGKLIFGLFCFSFGGMFTSCAKAAPAKAPNVEGYTLVWSDDFNGSKLNTDDWNYEYHEPGWVNNELQSYGDAKENIYVKGGNLVIQPLAKRNNKGVIEYTSGRVNTQNKHTITYGKVEVRAKAPQGKGFLPAIWMMPNDENLYGQWPKCGEIDIMEVLGHQPKVSYGTLHFGEPHSESQGKYLCKNGDFASDFHVYGMEWEPGEIRFYIDGELFHKENDWYSKKSGYGEVTYPAPFDQPFYLILNVAVGGNWPGNPDSTTKFDKNAAMYIDYVRLYQLDSYNEDVAKPEKKVKFREADATGNFVINSDFAESDMGKSNWTFLTAGKGKGSAKIHDNEIQIDTEDCGELDYSIQLVQPGMPMYKGSKYKLTFDISADKERTAIVAITAPDAGWIRYLNDTKINIGPKKKSFSFDIEMKDDTDANGRVEFNLGNQGSNATVHITNVKLVKTGASAEVATASCLPDGNFVYNGKFQEGKGRMEYWEVWNGNDGSYGVTNKNNIREFYANVTGEPVKLIQKKLGILGGKEYKLSFTAHSETAKTVTVELAGQKFEAKLSPETSSYDYVFTTKSSLKGSDITFVFADKGTTFIDDVRLQENTLIINGDFAGGMTGYEVYAYTSSDVTYVVDTLNEKDAFSIDIANTGDMDWKIQLKQNDVILEKGGKYKISFDAKANTKRKIMYALQRDGSNDDNWIPYSGTIYCDLTEKFQNFSTEFEMKEATDIHTILSISMGAVDGKQIKTKHTVVIDNIVLEKLN